MQIMSVFILILCHAARLDGGCSPESETAHPSERVLPSPNAAQAKCISATTWLRLTSGKCLSLIDRPDQIGEPNEAQA